MAEHPGRVLFCSHTRAAAQEALSRWPQENSDRIDIQTLHSVCFRALKLSRAQTVDDVKLRSFGEEFGIDMSEEGIGPEFLEVYGLSRVRCVTPAQGYEQSWRPGTASHFKAFVSSYVQWKEQFGYMDFDDMLSVGERVLKRSMVEYALVAIDEAQDLTPLHWRVIYKMTELLPHVRFVVSGDDDQCQPTGTLIETQYGSVPIEKLRPGYHKVWSGGQETYGWQHIKAIVSRPYSGNLIEIQAGDKKSKYTPDHICMARSFGSELEYTIRAKYLVKLEMTTVGVLSNTPLKTTTWSHFQARKVWYNGPVYSLEVEGQSKTYFGDGILTHNCLYSFAGADPSGMPEFAEKTQAEPQVLSQSYRVTQQVHDVAQAIISRVRTRVPKKYAPRTGFDGRPAQGKFEVWPNMDYLQVDKTRDSLLIYNDRFVRSEVEPLLQESGFAYKALNGFPSPLDSKAGRALRCAFTNDDTTILADDDLRNVIRGGLSSRGVSIWDNIGAQQVLAHIRRFDWQVLSVRPQHLDYLRAVDYTQPQNLRISTIHGSKGLQADDVHVILSLSTRAWQEAAVEPDHLHRLMYVAMTRAKENLFLYDGEGGYDLPVEFR